MKMTIDAMDLLYSERIDGFGVMSSDSDFMPMAMRIRQDGLPVYGFGSSKTPEAFKQACSRFIDVDALIKAEKEDGASGEKGEVDEEIVALLIDAYDAAKRDEKGFAALSAVGQRAGNRSSFDVRNYGYARLSDLIETIPNFSTKKRANGQVWVKRIR